LLAKIATSEQANSELLVPEFTKGLTFLEQLTVFVSEGRCSNASVPYLYHVGETGLVTFGKGACKMWSCPECALKNVKRWIARIIDGINKIGGDWYFATVTAHKWWRGEKSLINLRTNWHKLRKRMVRRAKKMGIDLAYVRVWEHHEDGSYHMHIINNCGVNTRWLKDNASDCGMGFMAHSDEMVNAGQAAGYVAKYMLKQSKEDTLHSFPKGARRIEASHNWVAWHGKKNEDWHYAGNFEIASSKSAMMKSHGKKVNDLALRNEKKKGNKKHHEYTKHRNEGDENGYPHSGKLVKNAEIREERNGRKYRLRPEETRSGSAPKSNNSNIDPDTTKTSNGTQRILDHERPKTKDNLRQSCNLESNP